jgi:hypothetical protein
VFCINLFYSRGGFHAKLYGLTEKELHYTFNPQDVFGPDFSGETFRVIKEEEIK